MEEHSVDEVNEPLVTSTDPNERKLARRLRIQRRWEAIKRLTIIEEDLHNVHKEPETNPILLQLKKSADVLERFVIEGEEYITNVRIANDAREVDRRESEGINRDKIIQKLEDEIVQAQEMFDNIANKWTNIQNYKDPLHIHDEIMNQKEKCDELIKQKDGIIAMLKEEIKTAERHFTKDQRKQVEDINTLAQRIEKQITFMRRAYRTELELIENVILTERQAIIEAANKKWEELYKKREQQEILNSQKKFEQVEEFHEKMEQLRMDFQEKYRETKIKLENDIEELQRELEKIKAIALINSEKLDYNYQILKKREDENIIIKSQQKRRINKLQDVINGLRRKIDDYEKNTSNQIKKIEDDIQNLHKSILEVESKADYFAKVNDEKFHKIWELNRQQVEEILKKILETDRILYEQQMGIDWQVPFNFVVDKRTLPSFKAAYVRLQRKPSVESTPSLSMILGHPSTASKKESAFGLSTSEVTKDDDRKSSVYRKTIKHILMRVSDKSGFLSEKRLGVLLKPYQYDQRGLVKLDNVFEALNIQEEETIDILVSHFYPYSFCHSCNYPTLVYQVESVVESKLSYQQSQLSSVFTRFPDDQQVVVPELQEVIDAIQIPEHIVGDLVQDLVDSDELAACSRHKSLEPDADNPDIVCAGPQEFDTFLSYVFTADRLRDKKSRMLTQRSGSDITFMCTQSHPLVISPVYVLTALREFVTKFYVTKESQPTMGDRMQKVRDTISRQVSEVDIVSFWEKFKKNFGENRVRVWTALLEGLKKYHEILKDRKVICEEVMQLRKENAELRRLLGNYLEHGDVMSPPCAFQQEENFVKATLPHYTNKK